MITLFAFLACIMSAIAGGLIISAVDAESFSSLVMAALMLIGCAAASLIAIDELDRRKKF